MSDSLSGWISPINQTDCIYNKLMSYLVALLETALPFPPTFWVLIAYCLLQFLLHHAECVVQFRDFDLLSFQVWDLWHVAFATDQIEDLLPTLRGLIDSSSPSCFLSCSAITDLSPTTYHFMPGNYSYCALIHLNIFWFSRNQCRFRKKSKRHVTTNNSYFTDNWFPRPPLSWWK